MDKDELLAIMAATIFSTHGHRYERPAEVAAGCVWAAEQIWTHVRERRSSQEAELRHRDSLVEH